MRKVMSDAECKFQTVRFYETLENRMTAVREQAVEEFIALLKTFLSGYNIKNHEILIVEDAGYPAVSYRNVRTGKTALASDYHRGDYVTVMDALASIGEAIEGDEIGFMLIGKRIA